jgi:hypothetical protein
MSNLQPNGFATTVIGAALTYVMGNLSKVAPILLLDTKCRSQKPPAPLHILLPLTATATVPLVWDEWPSDNPNSDRGRTMPHLSARTSRAHPLFIINYCCRHVPRFRTRCNRLRQGSCDSCVTAAEFSQ